MKQYQWQILMTQNYVQAFLSENIDYLEVKIGSTDIYNNYSFC